MKKDNFGDRMKDYEKCGELILPQNLPIIVRLDGNSFSKLTKRLNFKKPFDDDFSFAMQKAMEATLEYTGAKIGYCQSDEITLLILNPLSQKFLSNRVSKICSLLASTASNAFNQYFCEKDNIFVSAAFDCRVFVVPEKEVNNVFLWRQKDAWKNAVYSYAFFKLQEKNNWSARKTTKFLMGKSLSDKKNLILKELNFNINDLETKYKIGFCTKRIKVKIPISELSDEAKKYIKNKTFIERSKTFTDFSIPLFNEEPNYIESLLDN